MRRGLTLVEVMVVSALVVVLTGMLLAVQQSTSRRTLTTDRKREAIVRSHRAYQVVRRLLATSDRYALPGQDGFDEDGEATAHAVQTPRGRAAFDPASRTLAVREARMKEVGDVTFHAESPELVAFTVDSGPSDAVRERSQLYGKHHFELPADERVFAAWPAPAAATSHTPLAGVFAFGNPTGYRPRGAVRR